MPIAVLKDGPMPGHEIDVPVNAPTLRLNVGSSTVDFERVGSGEGERIFYTATSIVERTKTPPKSKPTRERGGGITMTPTEAARRREAQRAPAKKVPAPLFTGGDSEGGNA